MNVVNCMAAKSPYICDTSDTIDTFYVNFISVVDS
jgi:hypothetical protein